MIGKIKTKIFKDFGVNIIASLVLVGALQLFVYPQLAILFSSNTYGLILTLMGIVNIIVVGLGTSLNNIRLVQNTEYLKQGINGDFKILLIGAAFIGVLIFSIISQFIFGINQITTLLLIFVVLIGLYREYFCVSYRLKLSFRMNMICNCIIASGYITGLFAVKFTGYWPVAFLIGELCGCFFILITTSDIKRESFRKTSLFKQTSIMYFTLILSGLIGNLIVYLDRLILYPTLGGNAVAIYTVASFFGKCLGLVLVPIASVLLSYYAQKNFEMTRSLFWRINLAVLFLSIIFYFISYYGATWFTGLLYPTLIGDASPYIVLANIAAIIGAAASMTQPAVIKYASMYWQIVVQFIYGAIYLIGGIIFLKYFNLTGFCIAAIVASCVRLLTLYWIGDKCIYNYEVKKINLATINNN